jgi:hypothetical protein
LREDEKMYVTIVVEGEKGEKADIIELLKLLSGLASWNIEESGGRIKVEIIPHCDISKSVFSKEPPWQQFVRVAGIIARFVDIL